MAESLFYLKVVGHQPNVDWEMGMYAVSDTLSPVGAFLTWQSWCYTFFVFGPTHEFGYIAKMTSQQFTGSVDLYTVDPITDRKTKYDSADFYHLGTSGGSALPGQVAPLVLMRPAELGRHRTGRMYLPAGSSEELQDGYMWSVVQHQVRDFLTDAFAVFAANNLHAVIRNRDTHSHVLVASASLSNRFAVVHSRGPGPDVTYLDIPV